MSRKNFYWFVKEITLSTLSWFGEQITLLVVSLLFFVAVVLLALLFSAIGDFVDSVTPESVKISRRIEQARRDSLTTLWMEEQNRKLADEDRAEEARRIEEERRAEEARYKKHLLYVVARFNKKDSTSRRFIVLNTSRADIDSGRAIVFAHSWGGKAAFARVLDTTEIALRPIPSGRRDTLVVPPHGRSVMRYAIDSVALVGIVFR